MKMKVKSILTGAIALMLVFASCTPKDDTVAEPSSSANTSTNTEGAASTPNASANTADALFSVGGKAITDEEFTFWIYSNLSYAGVSTEDEIDWTQSDATGMPLADFILSESVEAAKLYAVIDNKSKELGLTLTAEENDSINNVMDEYLSYHDNDQAALDEYMKTNHLTEEIIKYSERTSILYGKLIEEVLGTNGEKVSDEAALEWGEENGVLHAKHILFKTKSDDRVTPLSDDLIAEAKSKADSLYTELNAISDRNQLLSTYDIRMQDMSEDPGKITYPDGYQFVPGTMRENFTATIQGLKEYGISAPIDIEDGYSIMLRLPLDPDIEVMTTNGSGSLRMLAANTQLNELLESWTNEIEVVYSEKFNNIDIADYLAKQS